MKSSYEARITIRAPRERIWKLLTEAEGYPSWNETITKLEGQVAVGQDLKVWTTIDPKRAFPAHVAEMDPGRRMVWSFSAPLGMFKGERTFTLEETADGVDFHTREVFGGWMAFLIVRTMPDLQPTFDAWARCLKAAAEAPPSATA